MAKKIIMLFLVLTYFALGQTVNLKNRDSIAYNQFQATDILGVQKILSGDYIWYKTSMYALERYFRESILAKENTWSQLNTFTNIIRSGHVAPRVHDTYWLGWWTDSRWLHAFIKNGYFENIFIVPTGNPDSSQGTKIEFDGNSVIFNKPIMPADSAAQDIGSINKPMDTLYAQTVVAPFDFGIIAQGSEGNLPPPDSIWKHGVLAKPGILHYSQVYPTNSETTSLTAKSEIIFLNVGDSGGSIDTIFIGQEIIASLGVPIITIYHYGGSDTITITDTDGGGYNFCIRAEDDIVLSRYGSVRLMLDKNIHQWIVIGVYNAD